MQFFLQNRKKSTANRVDVFVSQRVWPHFGANVQEQLDDEDSDIIELSGKDLVDRAICSRAKHSQISGNNRFRNHLIDDLKASFCVF